MHINYLKISVASLLSVLSMQTNAQVLNYNFLQAGFSPLQIDIASVVTNDDGFTISGTFDISTAVLRAADYSEFEFDFSIDTSPANTDTDNQAPYYGQTDFSGIFLPINESNPDSKDTEYGFNLGIRHLLHSPVELEGSYKYQEVFIEPGTSYSLGGRYYFDKTVSASVSYTKSELGSDDLTAVGLSLRLSF